MVCYSHPASCLYGAAREYRASEPITIRSLNGRYCHRLVVMDIVYGGHLRHDHTAFGCYHELD